jgi:hypothetical protein
LANSNEDIVELIEQYEKESKALKFQLIKLCWYMRGSITIDQMYELSISDREQIVKLINENLETAKEIKQPFW